MLKLLQLIFVGHFHKWKILRETRLSTRDLPPRHGTRFYLQCEKCGMIRNKDVT